MNKDFVAVLDFGSGKVTCMAASKVSDSGEFLIKAVGQCAYNGFDDNSWYEPETIADTVKTAVSQVETKLKCRIKEIYVGVPGAFSAVATGEASLSFHSKKKIDSDDVDEILRKADIFGDSADGIAIGSKAVYYILDGALKEFNPVGAIASKLTGLISFSFMKTYFQKTVSKTLTELGINKVVYLSVCQAQADYISSMYNVNNYSVIIDVGHITTNVMLSGGKGLLFAKTFSLGSGYLASDLCQVLGCDFPAAMRLIEKMNLNLEFQAGDAYSVDGLVVDASQANEVVKARIGQIAEYIIRSFDYCDKEIPRNTPIILTGGGLAYLRGGADCLSGFLGKPVKVYDSANPQTRRNEYTSCYGLISEAVRSRASEGGMFSLFKKMSKRR